MVLYSEVWWRNEAGSIVSRTWVFEHNAFTIILDKRGEWLRDKADWPTEGLNLTVAKLSEIHDLVIAIFKSLRE
jgi:hypothetical protein